MDPTANLEEQRRIATLKLTTGTWQDSDFHRLCELVEALDEWITQGGSLPVQWSEV